MNEAIVAVEIDAQLIDEIDVGDVVAPARGHREFRRGR